jgi:sensor histidine kinase YesM
MKWSAPFRSVAIKFFFALFGALIFGGIFVAIQIAQTESFSFEFRRGFVLLTFYGVCMAALNLFFFALIERWNRNQYRVLRLALQALAAFLLTAILSVWIAGHLILFIYPDLDVLQPRQYLLVSFYSMMFGLPVFLYLAVNDMWKKALQRIREKEVAQERLEKELLAARLQALQAQTNPHFLFNTLNSIAALIATDPARAEATVERLAGLFRYATDSHDGRLAPLGEEVAVIEDYLAIEKVRFGDRMRASVWLDPRIVNCRVPPLLLQPLVENAIKHGVSRREDETAVEVRIESTAPGRLRFAVRNQGPPPAAETSWQGVGLSNVRSRCRALFGDKFSFRLTQTEPGWTKAELEIPHGSAPTQSQPAQQGETP